MEDKTPSCERKEGKAPLHLNLVFFFTVFSCVLPFCSLISLLNHRPMTQVKVWICSDAELKVDVISSFACNFITSYHRPLLI